MATKWCIPPNSETEQSVSWTAPPFANNIHHKQKLINTLKETKCQTDYCLIRRKRTYHQISNKLFLKTVWIQ
jgi:hypothetical protein